MVISGGNDLKLYRGVLLTPCCVNRQDFGALVVCSMSNLLKKRSTTSRMECPTLGDGSSMCRGGSLGVDSVNGVCMPPISLLLQVKMGELDMNLSGMCAG